MLPNDAAEKDQLNVLRAEQLHRDVQPVRNDLQISFVFDVARNLVRGGAGIENDGVAVVDHLGGGGADPPFLIRMQFSLDLERWIHAHRRDLYGPAMCATNEPPIMERFQITADRNLGRLEAFTQTAHGDLTVLFQEFEDSCSAFDVQHRALSLTFTRKFGLTGEKWQDFTFTLPKSRGRPRQWRLLFHPVRRVSPEPDGPSAATRTGPALCAADQTGQCPLGRCRRRR